MVIKAPSESFSVKDGEFRQYRGPRDKENFISFVEDRKYRDMETLPSWKHPNTVQMSLVSYFYKVRFRLLIAITT